MTDLKVVRFPKEFLGVQDAIARASEMNLSEVLILSQLSDGSLVFLSNDDMTLATSNWLLDRAKWHLHAAASGAA